MEKPVRRWSAGGSRPAAWRASQWLAALRIIHPFPTIANALVAGGLGLIALGRLQFNPALGRLTLAMLAMQASIGTVNDLADEERDAAAGRPKPLVTGAISTGTARVLALVFLAATAILSAGFGLAAWLLAIAALSCGLVYDLKLSRTPWSVLPYLIALPLVPIWIWTALGVFRPLLLSVLPLGALLGFSLHLANGLTDFDSDARTASGGLVQRLGARRARGLGWSAFALVLLLVLASLPVLHVRPAPLLAGLGLAAGLLLSAIALAATPLRAAALISWGLLVAGSAALALGWLAALPGR